MQKNEYLITIDRLSTSSGTVDDLQPIIGYSDAGLPDRRQVQGYAHRRIPHQGSSQGAAIMTVQSTTIDQRMEIKHPEQGHAALHTEVRAGHFLSGASLGRLNFRCKLL